MTSVNYKSGALWKSRSKIYAIDGNNGNRDPSNIEVLCAMCHRVVTLREKHHLGQKTEDRRTKLADIGDLIVFS